LLIEKSLQPIFQENNTPPPLFLRPSNTCHYEDNVRSPTLGNVSQEEYNNARSHVEAGPEYCVNLSLEKLTDMYVNINRMRTVSYGLVLCLGLFYFY
jgi:hypothetical protein